MHGLLEADRQGSTNRETRRVDRLGLTALSGLAVVCLVFWTDLYGLALAAGTVAGVMLEPVRLAGATLWAMAWFWGLV